MFEGSIRIYLPYIFQHIDVIVLKTLLFHQATRVQQSGYHRIRVDDRQNWTKKICVFMQKWIRMDGIFVLCQSATNLGNLTQFSHLRKPSEGGINGDWNSKLEHFCNTAPAKKRDASHQTELLFVTPTLMFHQNFIL